jgi:hypothetical protein
MLACPAEGHFAASQKKINYIAFYIRKAAKYRLPDYDPLKGPPVLKPVDPTRMGWLMDKWRYNQGSTAGPAPVGGYKGDPSQAFWFFDEEMVGVTEKYEAAFRDQRAPLLGYVQEGKIAKQRDTHLQVSLKFLPEEDGISFILRGVFLDTVPGESPRPAMWTGLPAGSVVGHPGNGGVDSGSTSFPSGSSGGRSGGGSVIHIDRVAGPFEKVNDSTFRLALGKGIPSSEKDGKPLRNYALTFIANWPGDARYKPAVQQAEMIVPAAIIEGVEQHIFFPVIPDRKAGSLSVKLAAVSDAGLPVSYYVSEGPAEIKGNTLYLTKVPPRSRYPVKVTVVAWQYGRSGTSAIKTASSVQQTFFITKSSN